MSRMPPPRGQMPPMGAGPPPGMGPPQMGMPAQGMGMPSLAGGSDNPVCPMCGQPTPMGSHMMNAPNAPLPQGQLGLGDGMPGMGGGQDDSALLMALLSGGMGGGGGGMP